MKKLVLIIIVTVMVFGTAGYAYAQTQSPSNVRFNNDGMTNNSGLTGAYGGNGLMGSSFGAGSMGAAIGAADELLHDYIMQAFSDTTGLSISEIEVRLEAGETLSDIAVSMDMTLEEFFTMMIEVRTEALIAAVADGVITQEQADWMLDRLSQMRQGDMGSGVGDNRMGSGRMGTGQIGTGQMGGNDPAGCTMYSSVRGSGAGMRGEAAGTGTCIQTP